MTNIDGDGVSWMVKILPHIEQGPLFASINQSGRVSNGQGIVNPTNYPALLAQPAVYLCPSDRARDMTQKGYWNMPPGVTFAVGNYYGVIGDMVGAGAVVVGTQDCHNFTLFGLRECRGTFWRHSFMAPVTWASFRDGTSNTIIVGESTPDPAGWFAGWAQSNLSGSTAWPPNYNSAGPALKQNFAVLAGGFYSRHSGGVNHLFGDGHVTFITNNINMTTYRALGTRYGDEVIGEY